MHLTNLQTPALVLYPDIIQHNLNVTLKLLGGDAGRWRPHVKTAKLLYTNRLMVEGGVRQFKCATTLELSTACDAGATDVLVAYPCWGPRARRVAEIAAARQKVAISVLVEDPRQLEFLVRTRVGVFIDVNPGGDRTGVGQERVSEIVALAAQAAQKGIPFRGLHYYDGHHRQEDLGERTAAAHRGYDQLLTAVEALRKAGHEVGEIITSGTPALPCAIAYEGFRNAGMLHRVSPGTVIYNDTTSLTQLPKEWGYQAAVHVLTTVVSHPKADIVTCDAGHKTVSADQGFPNCMVAGRPELEPLHPSEEHLPIHVPAGAATPQLGEILKLIPRHVCPTVNNFDHAILIEDNHVPRLVPVTARGREAPL